MNPRWVAGACVAFCAIRLLGPVLSDPTGRLLGAYASEAGAHAELLGAALAGGHGPWRVATDPTVPDRLGAALVDPLAAMAMWPIWAVAGGFGGFTLAWNLLWLAALLGSAWGAWDWARACTGDEWGAAAAATIAASSLFLVHLPAVGRMESLFYALYPLHGAALFRGRWLLAGLTGALFVQSGGCGALFFAMAEIPVASWVLARAPTRGTVLGLAGVAVAAALSFWPVWSASQAFPYPAMGEKRMGLTLHDPLGMVGLSDDLLSPNVGYEYTPWVGAAALAGALLSGRVPAAIGVLLVVFAAGSSFQWEGGKPIPLPTTVLEAMPGPIGMVRGWPRLVAIAIPILGVAAAARGRLAVPLMALALVEMEARRPPGQSWTLGSPGGLEFPWDARARLREWLAPAGLPPEIAVLFDPSDPLSPARPVRFDNFQPVEAVKVSWCTWQEAAWTLRQAGFTAVRLRTDDLDETQALRAKLALTLRLGPAWTLPSEQNQCRTPEVSVHLFPPVATGEGRKGPVSETERARRRAARQAERERREAERRAPTPAGAVPSPPAGRRSP